MLSPYFTLLQLDDLRTEASFQSLDALLDAFQEDINSTAQDNFALVTSAKKKARASSKTMWARQKGYSEELDKVIKALEEEFIPLKDATPPKLLALEAKVAKGAGGQKKRQAAASGAMGGKKQPRNKRAKVSFNFKE